jgi:UPF0716 protein FxsA
VEVVGVRRIVLAGGLLLLAILVCEVLVFWSLVVAIGWGWALLVVLASTPLGGWLIRREGVLGWRRLRGEVIAGRGAAGVAAQGAVGLVGAILVMLPGLVSDVVGLLLVGPARPWVVAAVESRWAGPGGFGPRRVRGSRGGGNPEGDAPVVEGEIVD